MQKNESSTGGTLKNDVNTPEILSADNAPGEQTKSIVTRENGTPSTQTRQRNKTNAVFVGAPIRVSEQQFLTVKEETLTSLDLLNSSANVLLGAMEKMVPPADSPRAFGEYSAQGMRQLAKSVCDIVRTKCDVVRQIHSIARDEI